MKNQERRKKILEILRNSSSPVTGDQLAKDLDVSRQVIVLDMALLRSAGTAIVSHCFHPERLPDQRPEPDHGF